MHKLGAHETMQAHEILTTAINTMNTFHLIKGQIKDQQLSQIMDRQLNFMEKEYNDLLSYVTQTRGINPEVYQAQRSASINYGLRQPGQVAPATQAQLSDRDCASIMMGMHKCGAVCKMNAALECADPQLRRIIMQGANSCAEQAYELFTFMNQRGMYQVPTMQQQTQDNFMNIYQHSGTQGMMPHQANINYTGAQGLI
jgi:spore coat protein CotF